MTWKMTESGVMERMVEDGDKLHIQRAVHDLEHLFRLNQSEGAMLLDAGRRHRHNRLVGRIDLVTAEQWAKECGAGVGTKEFAAYCKRKLMDGDFAKFRVEGD